ncbi:hypothetical protein IVA79_26390 [Bradyrhizobium sp. 138]|uniref:hypothetical protein n=1 Tax=Bradyrhizobium sp. 138 TaxID=2782615 RepID=UPI001FF741C1|nr:hypothetical protein [Bradyrhizobium sp. 138]MCK1737418.1 hypothetical protein [Bradyrhizobium sp. 138]
MARADRDRSGTSMKSPVVVVAITLTAAILVAASLLIVVGTRKGPGTSTLNAPALQQPLKHAHLV